ncbi:MAG: hypothetical protein ACRDYX_09780 [Egibacteraceae bacterium]
MIGEKNLKVLVNSAVLLSSVLYVDPEPVLLKGTVQAFSIDESNRRLGTSSSHRCGSVRAAAAEI